METEVQAPPAEPELHLLTDWSEIGAAERRRKAAVGTVLFHVAVVATLMALPQSVMPPKEQPREPEHVVMPLLPPTRLTQKAPNTGKVMAQFQVQQASAPRPKLQAPPAPPAPPRQVPRPAAIPQDAAPKTNTPAAALPEAPAVAGLKPQINANLPPLTQPAPPPQIQAEEKPKLALENAARPQQPAAPTGRVPMPRTSVSEALQDTMHGHGLGGKQSVGDAGAFESAPFGGINSPPSPGVQGAGLELESDPMGVDFRPYLAQILAVVRRNWMAVMPESVHMGLHGKVALQLAIVRDGSVARLVYAEKSGARALDEAAVAGVSASNPLPALPPEFKGDRIVVQFNFVYNMPRR